MARVRSIVVGSQDVRPHPTEVDCSVQVISDTSGDRLFHLSSFGSDQRSTVPKVSQTLQFDVESARALRSFLDQFLADPPR